MAHIQPFLKFKTQLKFVPDKMLICLNIVRNERACKLFKGDRYCQLSRYFLMILFHQTAQSIPIIKKILFLLKIGFIVIFNYDFFSVPTSITNPNFRNVFQLFVLTLDFSVRLVIMTMT
jgi:hypothetical protein